MARLVGKSTELVKAGVKFSIDNIIPVLKVWQQYAMVELTPPSPRDFSAIRSGFAKLIEGAKTRRYRDVTVREGVINTLVAAEIYCWFFVGECIGKRYLLGYKA
ncbi:PREDICTED: ATP synthase subunit g, mitochondrial-like [Dinoponera quadriceps]|uniref:ATP synthase subunit g, mitochondrial-like n=1 Tax=Dinoponera quadriceps TaxID=609295 RepID=A0A6P3YC85_DINQU|nr:PREDICTED: ATP synthase subunit g, mitochondrial-like [Dinoponera quadriceps]